MNSPAKCFSGLLCTALAFLVLTPTLKAGGRIVVSNDEWMLGDCCLNGPGDNDAQFATNIAGWLTGGSGNILIVSDNGGVDGFGTPDTLLKTLLTSEGYSVAVASTTPTTLASLLGYKAVFLAGLGPDGQLVNNTLLINYVNSGGSVFLEAGTAEFGSAPAEAAAWNVFLNNFGLSLASVYNTLCAGFGTPCGPPGVDVSAFQTQAPFGLPLFGGVNAVAIDGGNDVLNLFTNPNAQVFTSGADGLYGAVQVTSGDTFYQTRYAANLNIADSAIDITNTGVNGVSLLGPGLGAAAGNICVNVYGFDPGEELISCCSCLITPDATVNLGVVRDLTSNSLTGAAVTSVTVKLLATLAPAAPGGAPGSGTSCTNTASTVDTATFANGMAAFGTTLHATPAATYASTETPFTPSALNATELASLAGRCAGIIGNGSGFGICASCRTGALGATKLAQ